MQLPLFDHHACLYTKGQFRTKVLNVWLRCFLCLVMGVCIAEATSCYNNQKTIWRENYLINWLLFVSEPVSRSNSSWILLIRHYKNSLMEDASTVAKCFCGMLFCYWNNGFFKRKPSLYREVVYFWRDNSLHWNDLFAKQWKDLFTWLLLQNQATLISAMFCVNDVLVL